MLTQKLAIKDSTVKRGEDGVGLTRERTLRRHEPSLCRPEPPRFAKQTKPPLCRREHAQYIKMCLCKTGGF